jgi:hypothetical protein
MILEFLQNTFVAWSFFVLILVIHSFFGKEARNLVIIFYINGDNNFTTSLQI